MTWILDDQVTTSFGKRYMFNFEWPAIFGLLQTYQKKHTAHNNQSRCVFGLVLSVELIDGIWLGLGRIKVRVTRVKA